MKKICYVLTIPLTVRAFFLPQIRYLASNGFDITVICSPDDTLKSELGDNVKFVPVEIPRGISVKQSIQAIHHLIDVFKKEKFDMVQYSTPNAAFYASIAAKKVKIPVRNYHLMGFRYLGAHGVGRYVLKMIEKITCRNSTSIECVSQSNIELGYTERLFCKDKACVVWNGSTGGVDLKRFDYNKREQWRADIRAELGYNKQDFVFGYVGRITKDKGIDELLQAYLGLKQTSKLLLIGDIELEQSLNPVLLRQARENPNIQFHDAVKDIERYYAAIDVLILPSYREGFGNVIIEAGAVGTPAIVSKIPGPVDAIEEGKTAYTVAAKDVSALANRMECMTQTDYCEMGKAAAAFVRTHFDSEILNQKILERKHKLLQIENNR